jgi:small-conductance mechanosensitive channel
VGIAVRSRGSGEGRPGRSGTAISGSEAPSPTHEPQDRYRRDVSLATIDNSCYEQTGSLCRWVYEHTDENETLAGLANWFVDQPFQILLVLAIAMTLTFVARRWVRRLIPRLLAPKSAPAGQLGRLGIDLPESLTPKRDPRRESRAKSASVVLTSTIVVTIWVIASLTILGIVGIQLGPLLAGAGVAGVALGFGAQSLVKDCIAGLFMLIEDQYGIGDVVDLGEAVGVVEEVSLRTTVLRSVDGTVWHVPNGVVQRVGNRSQLWSVAVVDVDVAYDTDIGRARDLLQRAAEEVCEREPLSASVIDPPIVLGVEALAADGVTLRVTVKVQPGTQWDLQRALREHTKSVFDEAGVEIPFPQRSVWMRGDPAIPDPPPTS